MQTWFNDEDTLPVDTSGSTSTPTRLIIPKKYFHASAEKTLQALQIQPGAQVVVALASDFIAGKMMLIRAAVGKLNCHLCPPSNAWFEAPLPKQIDLLALVPSQIEQLRKVRGDRAAAEILQSIDILLLGGGPLSPALEAFLVAIRPENARWLHTYGMTETLSHIAWRRLGDAAYQCLPGVSVQVNDVGCLVVTAPHVGVTHLVTNDLAELKQDTFLILGRADTVINSGGIKIIPATVEAAVAACYPGLDGVVLGIPDPILGQQAILVTEQPLPAAWPAVRSQLKAVLPKHHTPQRHFLIEAFPRSSGGKPLRGKILEKVSQIIQQQQ
jgi:O-succinylbenzoic acid--CoA ligase